MSTEEAGTRPLADSEQAWDQWWNIQRDLCRKVDERLDVAAHGRSDQFAAALVASLIEHLGERLRMYLRLPESDVRKDDPDA